MSFEYNYQEHPHKYTITENFDFIFWGVLITLAFFVGFGLMPWYAFLLVIIPNFLTLNIARYYSVSSTHPIDAKKAKKQCKEIKKGGV